MTQGNDSAFAYKGLDLSHPGLTKREYFAATAMQGLTAAAGKYVNGATGNWNYTYSSTEAVAMADALIAALNEETK